MLHVLHVIQELYPGGAFRALAATVRHSDRTAYRYSVLSLLPAHAEAEAIARKEGIRVVVGNDPGMIRREIESADIVQINWWNATQIRDLLAMPWPQARLLIFYHVAGDTIPHVVTPRLVEFADMNVPCNPYSQLDLEVFSALPPAVRQDKVSMVYGAADFDRLEGLRPRAHEGFNVGYIGTVDFTKMHPRFFEMSQGVRIPDARFLVCGTGTALEPLRKRAADLGADNRFDFRGYVSDIRPVLEVLDAYGYPLCEDTYAGSELNLQEVMYAGIPVVVFPHGGIRRLVVDGYTGLVVRSESEYAAALEHLRNEPEERKRIGGNAAAYARQIFGGRNAARRMDALYARMMLKPKRSRTWTGPSGPGAEVFVDSLGPFGKHFRASMSGGELRALLQADARIAASSNLVLDGGIRAYLGPFPNDPHLRFWNALANAHRGRPKEALLEYGKAIGSGFIHPRVHGHIALAAAAADMAEIESTARQALEKTAPGAWSEFQLPLEPQPTAPQAVPSAEIPAARLPDPAPIAAVPAASEPVFLKARYVVAAIVSTYKSQSFIRGCLEDLVNQTLFRREEMEIIVVDSGSPEDEGSIIREYQARYPRIVSIRSDRETIYGAWNRGVLASSARYLVNANCDDRHHPAAFEEMKAVLDARPESLVYVDALVTPKTNETFATNSAELVWALPDYSVRQVLVDCPFGCTVMWRREIHRDLGLFDATYFSAGDYEFFQRAALAKGAYHLARTLSLYYENASSLSYSDPQRVIAEYKRFLPKARAAVSLEAAYPFLADDPSPRARAAAAMDLGGLYMHHGAIQGGWEAELRYREAESILGAQPPELLINLANSLIQQKRPEEAQGYLEKVYAVFPQARQHQALTGSMMFTFPHPGLDALPPIVYPAQYHVPLAEYRARKRTPSSSG